MQVNVNQVRRLLDFMESRGIHSVELEGSSGSPLKAVDLNELGNALIVFQDGSGHMNSRFGRL